MDLRGRLDRGLDVDALVESHGGADGDGPDATTNGREGVEPGPLSRAVREEFDLPEALGDDAATGELDAAIEAIVRGEQGRARERLAEAFPTPCERHDPPLVETAPGRTSACLRHEPVREAVDGRVETEADAEEVGGAGGPSRRSGGE
jgi:peptide/nickel transport system ATP-binding protein